MWQTVSIIALTFYGFSGSILRHPFLGVAVYYLYAVLRPQSYWEWVLPDANWSFYVALVAMAGTAVWRIGVVVAPNRHLSDRFPSFNICHWATLFFAFWITVTYFTAFSLEAADKCYDEYRKIFLMFFVASLCTTTVNQLWKLYLIITGCLAYIAMEMNQIYVFQGYTYLFKRGFGGLDNNGAALMLAMGVPLCIFAWDGIKHPIRWLFMAMVPLIIHAVLTSYSRGAMLSLIMCLPVFMVRCRHKGQFALVLLVVGAMIPFMAGAEIEERFVSIKEGEEDGSAESRLTSWAIAWQMAQEKPIFGFGVRNSPLFTFDYGADMEGRVIHSQYLQIAADNGLVGLAGYLVMLAGALWCLRQVRWTTPGQKGFIAYIYSFFAFLTQRGRSNIAMGQGPTDADSEKAIIIAKGVEGAMIIFAFGSIFLSLETFELIYILIFMSAQLWAIRKLTFESIAPPSAVEPPEEEVEPTTETPFTDPMNSHFATPV